MVSEKKTAGVPRDAGCLCVFCNNLEYLVRNSE